MRKTYKYILLLISFLIGFNIYAKFTKEEKKEYFKSEEYRFVFDMQGTNYFDMDSIDFVEYYSAKNNMTPENFSVVLKYIGKEIEKELNNITHKKISQSSNNDCVIYIHLDEITPNAGMKVTVKTYIKDPAHGETYNLKIKDGRWNKFDVLLQENCKELAKKINNETGLKTRSVRPDLRDKYEDPIYR